MLLEKLLTSILNFCTNLCSLLTDVSIYGKTSVKFFTYSLKLKSVVQSIGVVGIKMWWIHARVGGLYTIVDMVFPIFFGGAYLFFWGGKFPIYFS